MQELDDAIAAVKAVHDYFGYKEDWCVIPLHDSTDQFWQLDGEGPGFVYSADSEEELESGHGNCYSSEIYTQRHLPKWVYRGAEYTMVVIDTHTDGNKFLDVYKNSLERPNLVKEW